MSSYKAITQLEIVSAPSLTEAIAACQLDRNERGTNYIVGNDWAMGQDSTEVTYACVGRSPVASLTDPATNVLVRVRVVDNTNDCLDSWERLFAPRDGVVVCSKWAPATPERLESFDFVADLDVANERFYGDAAPDWTTLPISAHIQTPNNAFAGVFLSVRYPSEPITDLRVLRSVSSVDACEDLLGIGWSSVGNIDPDAFVAFCVSRLRDPATDRVTTTPLALSINASVTNDLFVRFTQAPIYVHAPQDAAKIAKPPLRAKSVLGSRTMLLSFKILQLADLHFTGESNFACRGAPSALASNCTEHVMSQFIDDLLTVERPDFVVFTGDNVDTRSARYRTAAVDAFTRSVNARKIPFAFVLGNHDNDAGFPRDQVFAAVMNKSSCYAQRGPLNVDGLGNYALNVHAPTSGPWGNAAFPSTTSTYGWIQPSQLEYYRAMATENTAQSPALLFYHIPVPEYATTHFTEGEGNEPPCSASVNSHLHSTLADVGDVKATFVGHDHLNQYCAERDGVQLCYGGGAGFGLAYGDTNFQRRARVIEWVVNGSNYHEIRTWSRFYGNLSEKHLAQVLFQKHQAYNVSPGNATGPTRWSKSVGESVGSTFAAGVILLAVLFAYWWKAKRHADTKAKSAQHMAAAAQPPQVVDPFSTALEAQPCHSNKGMAVSRAGRFVLNVSWNRSIEPPQRLSSSHITIATTMPSRMAITKLRVVSAPSLGDAIADCQRDRDADGTSYVVGSDWAMGHDSANVTHLCVQRQPAASIQEESPVVLQRISVFQDSHGCPATWSHLLTPRDGIVVCTKWASATSQLMPSFNYITDIEVAHERFYGDCLPSWTTLPISVHTKKTGNAAGVFLSVRYPSEPITDLRVLQGVSSIDACDSLGVAWSPVDNIDPDVRVALCISRLPGSKLLTGLTIRNDPSETCSGTTLPVTDTVSLCATWGQEKNRSVVSDLLLVSSLDPNAAAAVKAAAASGFTKLTTMPLAISSKPNVRTHLFARSTEAPTYIPAPQDAAVLAKPRLNATLNADNVTLSFKILQLADLHYTGDPDFTCKDPPHELKSNCTERIMSQFIDDLLDLETPDFVVFTGDNVHTFSAKYRSLAVDAFTRSVEARGIPFAFILGNHDDNAGFSREAVFAAAMNKTMSYAQHGPLNIDGVGNYALNVHAPANGPWGKTGDPVYRLYFLDSHGETNKTAFPLTSSRYAWIQPNQVEYFKSMAAENTMQTPAVLFHHIPTPEYGITYFSEGDSNEVPGSSAINSHLVSVLIDVGDVKATFVGHDHVNDFCAERDGVQLCYGGSAGFGESYGKSSFPRRARVIEWSVDESNRHELRTWSRFYGKLSEKYHPQVLYQDNHTFENMSLDNVIWPRNPAKANIGIFASAIAGAAVVGLGAAVAVWRKAKRRRHNKATLPTVVPPSPAVTPVYVSLVDLRR